jgi:AraC-like DNA-binding protein
MSGQTVSAGYVRSFLKLAASKGAAEAELLRDVGLTPEQLAAPDARLAFADFVRLMRAAKTACHDPALALHFGASSPFNEVSIVGLIAFAARTMGEAFQQLNRYSRLVVEVEGHDEAGRFAIVRREDGVWLEDRRRNPDDFPELTESTWVRFVHERARFFPSREPYVLEVHVTHVRPAHADAYKDYFDMPVIFSSTWNALKIRESWLDEPTGNSDRYVFGVFNAHAEALLKSLMTEKSVKGQIEATLIPILHTGAVSIEDIARKLGFSRATLQRRLQAEGVTYESVLDGLRQRMAMDYLSARKISVSETAYLTGFSDPAAFSRAFKRWTGLSPGKFRDRETGTKEG